ncbi:gastric triacylglycerol lipase-like [Dendronephthya gigantea]|uniref:gastric triacylglycerol lipase-like n=1 Tax=Dendronephthya gigantea TaxID=151771 RepID=UPI00106D1138|nr:gastric triacylglycerol lipase-like [Dendronephthya gigantea]
MLTTRYIVFSLCLVARGFAEDPEINMNVAQIIQHWGYPAEEYDVATSDGYILTVQRVPRGRNDQATGTKRPVVFLQHGLLGSSSQWVTNLPHQSLAFILADKGFDVWLGNSRGNTYGLKHERLSTDTDEFWDFSFDEFAKYDLPASLEFAMARSQQRTIAYIGHSQGTTIGFAAFSRNQTLAAKINLFIALAPVATVGNMKSPIRYMSYLSGGIQWLSWLFGVRDFLPSTFVTRSLGRYVCEDDVGSAWCSNIMFLLCGYDKKQLNMTRLPVYVAHTPAGTSVKDVAHFAQMYKSGKFQMYDYGWRYKNRMHYGQSTPKLYDVSKIRVPVALFSADKDWLATPKDVSKLKAKLKTVVFSKDLVSWDHLDFIWGMDAPSLIYEDIAGLLKNSNRLERKNASGN